MSSANEYPQQSVQEVDSNKWSAYFGPPAFPIHTDANAKTSYDRFDLPVAYKGQNLFLAETIDSFILDQTDIDFTSKILPIQRTNQINVAWNTWAFDETLAGRVPHEGVSRLIRSKKSEYSDKLVRRGLAFMLEHGFMNTEQGRQQYVRNIQEIVKAVQLTMSFDVLSALLSCKRYNIQWEREHGYFDQRLPDIMKREVNMFGIIQRDANGFDILLEEHKKLMNRYAVAPDALILPSKVQIYLPMVPPEKTRYLERGDKGPAGFDAGAIADVRGIKIYEAKTYDLSDGDLPVNLLSSTEQIGQYNLMSCETTIDADNYSSSHRDIMVFDAELDNFKRVSFLEAMKHTFRFDPETGELSKYHQSYKESADDVQDLFLFRKGSLDKSVHIAEVFGQMHMDKNRGQDFLPKDVVNKVAETILRDVSDSDIKALQEGAGVISLLQGMTGGSNPDTSSNSFSWGDSGWGDSWDSLELFAGTSDSRAQELVPKVRAFQEAFRRFYRHLKQVLPESYLVETSAELLQTLGMAQNTTAEERGIKNLYANVFAKKHDRVAFSQRQNGEGGEYVSIGAKHEMNLAALKSSKAIDVKSYEDAVSKYADKNDMYSSIVHGTSDLIKQNLNDMNSPKFVSTYKLLEKMSGIKKKDKTVLDKMGVSTEAPAAPSEVSWKDSPLSWSKMWEGKQGAKRVVHPALEGVDADSDDFSKSLIFAQLNYKPEEVADEEEVSTGDWGLFSRKSKTAKVGAKFSGNYDEAFEESANLTSVYKKFDGQNISERYAHFKNVAHCAKKIAALAFLMTRINERTFETMHAHDIHIPVDILLARPFISFEMNHAILCKSGRDTGATYVGNSDFQLGDNVQSKLHFGHYTFYAKSMVSNTKNVTLLKNVFINDYSGGMSTDFYNWEDGLDDKREQLYTERHRPSIFAMMIPAGSNIKSNPVDIRKEFPYYNHVLSFDTLSDPNFDQEFFTPNEISGGNPIIYRAVQYAFDPVKKSFSKLTVGTGHLGRDVGPGIMSVYSGAMKYVEKQHYVQSY